MSKNTEGSTLERSSAANRVGAGQQTTAEHFRMLVENMKDYAIIILDTDGRVASWNPGSEIILGYRSTEIIGQHFSRFFPLEEIQRGKPEMELKVASAEGRSPDLGQARLKRRADSGDGQGLDTEATSGAADLRRSLGVVSGSRATWKLSHLRLISAATYPAPNPLSMFTTLTFEAQEFIMPSRAASPSNAAP